MSSLQTTKEVRARSLDRPKVRFIPTKDLGEGRRIPEMVVLRRRYAIELAIEPNKLGLRTPRRVSYSDTMLLVSAGARS